MARKSGYTESDLDKVIKSLKRKDGDVRSVLVEVYHKRVLKRSARKNTEIRWMQFHMYKRNPWFYRAKDLRAIKKVIEEGLGPIDRYGWHRLEAAAERVGFGMTRIFTEHIRLGQSKQGPMPKNTKDTEIRKAKKHGRRLPVLIDTGRLKRSVTGRHREV